MRINNVYLNNPILIDDNILKQGSIFKGKILEIMNEELLMEIKNHGNLKATLDTKVQINVDDEITFLVKSAEGEKVELKALIVNDVDVSNMEKGNKKTDFLSKVLGNIKNLKIKDSSLSFELAKSLMENNIQLSEENLTNSIKILDKLIELSELDSSKKVIFLDGKVTRETVSIDQVESNSNLETNNKKNIDNSNNLKNSKTLEEVNKESNLPQKVNIKNLLVTDKNSYYNKEDLSSVVKNYLFEKGQFKLNELPKLISFLIKNDIKPSLSNIANLRDLSENPEMFLKEFAVNKDEFKEFINKNFKNADYLNENKSLLENLNKSERLEINGFKELEEIIKEIKSFKSYNNEEKINIFNDKIDFLKELNKNLSFMFIPINYKPGNLDGLASFLKRKRKNTKDGKINVFIDVDTKLLGNVKVSCNLQVLKLSIKINIDKKDLNLFKSNENLLIDKIENIGFELNNIEYVFDDNLKLIEQITVNDSPNYFLDIKV